MAKRDKYSLPVIAFVYTFINGLISCVAGNFLGSILSKHETATLITVIEVISTVRVIRFTLSLNIYPN